MATAVSKEKRSWVRLGPEIPAPGRPRRGDGPATRRGFGERRPRRHDIGCLDNPVTWAASWSDIPAPSRTGTHRDRTGARKFRPGQARRSPPGIASPRQNGFARALASALDRSRQFLVPHAPRCSTGFRRLRPSRIWMPVSWREIRSLTRSGQRGAAPFHAGPELQPRESLFSEKPLGIGFGRGSALPRPGVGPDRRGRSGGRAVGATSGTPTPTSIQSPTRTHDRKSGRLAISGSVLRRYARDGRLAGTTIPLRYRPGTPAKPAGRMTLDDGFRAHPIPASDGGRSRPSPSPWPWPSDSSPAPGAIPRPGGGRRSRAAIHGQGAGLGGRARLRPWLERSPDDGQAWLPPRRRCFAFEGRDAEAIDAYGHITPGRPCRGSPTRR